MSDNISTTSFGTLYIVATPIGNLEDITFRAVRILKEVDYIGAEDTRHTQKLLNHYGIKGKLISYFREKEQQRADHLIHLLKEGKNIALVSDAGTPSISDPGGRLVQMAHLEKIRIVPIPGACAFTSALSCYGMGDSPILFLGFIPPKTSQRKKIFQSLTHSDYYTVFYESPHKLAGFLRDALNILGDRNIFIARELTKTHEEIFHTSLKDMVESTPEKGRGEYVLIFAPVKQEKPSTENIDELIYWYRDEGDLSLKDCSKKISKDLGLSRSLVYKRAIQIWNEGTDQ